MAELMEASASRDVALYIGMVQAVNMPRGDPDDVRYDIFLRHILNPSKTLSVQNHKIKKPRWINVEVVSAAKGDPVIALQTPKGLFIYPMDQLDFTDNCE